MDTERGRAGLRVGIALGALALGGCASGFAQADLERVRALSKAVTLPDITEGKVAEETSAEVRRLLERPLDANAAAEIAVLNNRELRASLREMGVARGRMVEAGTLPNPHVEVEKPVEPEVKYELGVELDLTAVLLAPVRARAASADVEAARHRAAAAVVDTALEARSAFYAAQAAEQKLHIAQRALDGFAAARDAARALHDAGNIAALKLASHEAAYERARVLVAELELDVASTREQLQRILGLHGRDTHWRLAETLPPAPDAAPRTHDSEAAALQASHDLAESRSRLEALARRTGVTRAEGWLPDVSVGVRAAGLAHQGSGDARTEDSRDWRFGGGLTLSIPLFDRKQGRVAALGAEFDAGLERHHGTAVRVRSAARELDARLTSAHARARQYQTTIVPAQRMVTRQTVLQFNAMQVGVFELLLARREELDAELAYVDALRGYWTALAARDALLAGGRASGSSSGGSAAASFGSANESAGGH